jgi:site-specific DNA-methyltransferase (adenine-specific)
MTERVEIVNGDSLLVLQLLDDNSVDAIVTDPPYGLAFMGKKWDYDVPSEELWRQCFRVLKAGGHLLCFAGTRTQHRMAVRIEDAGFEIRDMIAYVYGSGFPKSLDVSKAIDKAAGAEREVVGQVKKLQSFGYEGNNCFGGDIERGGVMQITTPATPEAKQWQGWGTALKPALEPITVARKPLIGTVAENVLRHGTGAINVDGCRVGTETWTRKGGNGSTPYGSETTWNTSKTPDIDRTATGRWPANFIHDGSEEVVGLFPDTKSGFMRGGEKASKGLGMFGGGQSNADTYGDSGSAARFFYCAKASKRDRDEGLDCIEIITIFAVWEKEEKIARLLVNMDTLQPKVTVEYTAKNKNGLEWSTLLFGKIFTEQFHSECKSITSTASNLITESKTLNVLAHYITKGYIAGVNLEQTDGGSHAENAAKSSTLILTTNEKTALALGVENAVLPTQLKINASAGQNIHSTVKPTDLMRYLCRLVTPPDGTVLDPFMGSGSTGKAAVLEGFRFIGIEREEEYCEIAKARIKFAQKEHSKELFPNQ